MSSGATTSAGRAKKLWGRCWESVVAMGVALGALGLGGGYSGGEAAELARGQLQN